MTIEIQLQWDEVSVTDSVTASEQSATLNYFAFTDDGEEEDEVREYAKTEIPDFYDGLIFTKLEIPGRHSELNDTWVVIARYESPASAFAQPKLAVDEVRWGIRTGGQVTAPRLYSLGLKSETVASSSGDAYKFDIPARAKWKNVVGLTLDTNKNFNTDGVDYSFAEIMINVETVKDNDQVLAGYIVNAAAWAARHAINNAVWSGFAAGTLRLDDYSAVKRAGEEPDWDIGFSLVFSPNLTDIVVSSEITVPAKDGHDLLDVLYLPEKLPDGPFSVHRAVRAAVHQWYPPIDFAAVLGI